MTLIWIFLICSWGGFLLEIVYHRLVTGHSCPRKCLLFLPLCPVYGTSMALIFLLPETVLNRPLLLFLFGGAIATGTEYLFAFYYEHVWGVKFWDYSGVPFQLHGRVCLPFSIIWGLLIAVLVPLFGKPLIALGEQIPPALLAGLFAAFLADWVCTGFVLRRSHDTESLRWWRPEVPFP